MHTKEINILKGKQKDTQSSAGLFQGQFASHSSCSHYDPRVSGVLGQLPSQEPNKWVAQSASSSSSNPLPLCRYWLNYESYLLENSVETVDMPFVKVLIQNISTDTSEDLLFSLMPSQVKSFLLAGSDHCWCQSKLVPPSPIQHSSVSELNEWDLVVG